MQHLSQNNNNNNVNSKQPQLTSSFKNGNTSKLKDTKIIQVPSLNLENIQGRIDLVQEGVQKRTTFRILDEVNASLSPNYSDQLFLNNQEQGSNSLKNIQNFTKMNTSSQNNYMKGVNKQPYSKIDYGNFNLKQIQNGALDMTPKTKIIENENRNDHEINRKIFEELDEWKSSVDNIKRIQNMTEQLFSNQNTKQNNFFEQNTYQNNNLQEQLSTQQSNPTPSQFQQQQQHLEEANQNEIMQSIIKMQNSSRYGDDEEKEIYPYYETVTKQQVNILGNNQSQQAKSKQRILKVEPKINEQIINSIMNQDDRKLYSKNYTKRKSNQDNSPATLSSKHFISNGASPQLKRVINSRQKNDQEDSIIQYPSGNNRNVTFKDDLWRDNQHKNHNRNISANFSTNKYQNFSLPKKTPKQVQAETNEMLIEKLFLMKLKKKIEPILNDHLQHRKINLQLSQNNINLNSNKELFKNELEKNKIQVSRRGEQAQNQQNVIVSNNSQFSQQQQPFSKYPNNQQLVQQNERHEQSQQQRYASPQQNQNRQDPGFLSQRDAISKQNNKINFNYLIKQQNIVKDEIENFQKKTLESFKFIQEIKRSRNGTPQLVNLLSGRKTGDKNNVQNTELYLKQIEKEFSLNEVKKNNQIKNDVVDAQKQLNLNEQLQEKLLEQFKSTIAKIKLKKQNLEHHRLECFKLQSMANQIQEEINKSNKRMQEELDQVQKQFYQLMSSNISNQSETNENNNNNTKSQQKSTKLSSISYFNAQINEKSETIKQDYTNKQKIANSKILFLKQNISEHTASTNDLTKELQALKNLKLSLKKQLKEHYLSLLQINKSSDSPQISVIQLIQLMQGIGEEVTEKMMPSYFDEHNIDFVKKLQRLSQEKELLQKEIDIALKSAKTLIHSQMVQQGSKNQSNHQFQQSQIELVSSPILNQKQKKVQENQIDEQNNQKYIQPQNLIAQQNPFGIFSSSLISQQQISQRNFDEEDKKLLQMMIGNTVNHKKEIKKKLQSISKSTVQQNKPNNKLYLPFYLPNHEDQVQNEIDTNYIDKQFSKINRVNNNSQSNSKLSFDKNEDECYFLLNNLKKGSLSVLDFQKKILERIQDLDNQIQNLKELEIDRMVKQYHNITSEERLQNVQKIFILMYGSQEGNLWNQKFTKKRRDIQLKSINNKTFNFQDAVFCNKKGTSSQPNLLSNDILQSKPNQNKQQIEQQDGQNKKIYSYQSQKEQEQKINTERSKIQMQFKYLQKESNQQNTINGFQNEIFFKDPLSVLSNYDLDQKYKKEIDKQANINSLNKQIKYNTQHKSSKSVHFQNSQITQKEIQNTNITNQNYFK